MTDQEKEELARRFAPVLVLWPEIPASRYSGRKLREEYAHRPARSSSYRTSGAHVTRDFHPRDIRLILDHAQAYQPRPPLPFMPVAFARAYRDLAKVFFWPLIILVVLALLAVGLAQGVPDAARLPIEIGAFVFIAVLFLMTLRSPIHVPTNSWHLINHFVMGLALAVMWFALVGYVDYILLIFFLVPWATSVYEWVFLKLRVTLFAPYRLLRFIIRTLFRRRASRLATRLLREPLVQGAKPADRYTSDSELFFKYPGENRALHRSDREGHWAAYSRALAAGNYARTYYARVLGPDEDGTTLIQYWFGYYYDDWANEHEGDWEMVCVLTSNDAPVGVAASQHEGGEYRDWSDLELRDGRPALYVAAGSHALYFDAGAHLTSREMFGLKIGAEDAPVVGGSILEHVDFTPPDAEADVLNDARVSLIPEPDPETGLWGHPDHSEDCNGNCESNFEWLNFPGRWGAGAFLRGSASGPYGPAFAGLRWDAPRMWVDVVCRKVTTGADAVAQIPLSLLPDTAATPR